MGKANVILVLFSLNLIAGCASLGGYNLPLIQKEFQINIQRNESLVSKANGDFVEKKVLVETLAKSNQPGWPTASPSVNTKLEEMNSILPKINRARAQMSELNGQLSALSYSRTKVNRDDEAWERADTIVREFDTASKNLSDSLNLYTRASNDLSDLITKNKLFAVVDLGAFQKRIQNAIVASNTTIREMNVELGRSERILNMSDEKSQLGEPQAIFEKMGSSAKEFGTQAQKLPELSSKVKESTLSVAKISSIDSNWTQIQRYMAELEGINSKLDSIKSDFNNSARELQESLKKFR